MWIRVKSRDGTVTWIFVSFFCLTRDKVILAEPGTDTIEIPREEIADLAAYRAGTHAVHAMRDDIEDFLDPDLKTVGSRLTLDSLGSGEKSDQAVEPLQPQPQVPTRK